VNDVCFDAGRLLARLARHRFPESGLLSATLDVDTSFMDGPITTTTLVERFVSAAPFERRFDRDARERIVRFAREREDRLAELAGEASLVHGDFNSPNVFAHEVNGRWRVAAILDWEFALAASPYCDIGNFLRYHRRARPRYEPHFSRGLVDGGMVLPNDWLAVARLVDMPAMCELLARETIPEVVVEEVGELLIATIEERDV
jgi:Ser/Thr protein kinase RdoA (MazF antagonist)